MRRLQDPPCRHGGSPVPGLAIDLFGENHVQELCANFDAGAYCGKPCHFIGHLQTNKIKKVLGRAAVIQSVDSARLLLAIEKEAAKLGLRQDILLEVNIAGEASKSGVSPEELWPLLELCAAQPHIQVRGLMAVPPVNRDDRAEPCGSGGRASAVCPCRGAGVQQCSDGDLVHGHERRF